MKITKAASILDLYIKTLFDRDCIVTIKSIDLDETSCTAKFTVIADHIITMNLTISLSTLNILELGTHE